MALNCGIILVKWRDYGKRDLIKQISLLVLLILESLAYDFGYLSQSRLPLRWQIVI